MYRNPQSLSSTLAALYRVSIHRIDPSLLVPNYIFFRLRSVGFDMLKQRGSWQATGVQPQDLGMEFNSMFTHEIEEASEVLVRKSGMAGPESRQLLSTAFQVGIK